MKITLDDRIADKGKKFDKSDERVYSAEIPITKGITIEDVENKLKTAIEEKWPWHRRFLNPGERSDLFNKIPGF